MSTHALTRLRLNNFTAFKELDIDFSPGLNVFIGGNSTGKTHLLKVLHAYCDFTVPPKFTGITVPPKRMGQKLLTVFLPSRGGFSNLVHRGTLDADVEILRGDTGHKMYITARPDLASVVEDGHSLQETPMEWAFIPTKEMLANAAGFLALYEKREVAYEEIYPDILRKALLPSLREEKIAEAFRKLLARIEQLIGGKVEVEGEEFFRRKGEWKLEFTLLAEGYRKLGLLWLLIRNGTIAKDSILFWDEPETNLNPSMMRALVGILLELQRLGVQIFLATHSYVVLKEFDLQKEESDRVRFFSLFRENEEDGVSCTMTEDVDLIDPNVILDTFVDLYDRDVERALDQGGEL